MVAIFFMMKKPMTIAVKLAMGIQIQGHTKSPIIYSGLRTKMIPARTIGISEMI
jgi:hypothetical protein